MGTNLVQKIVFITVFVSAVFLMATFEPNRSAEAIVQYSAGTLLGSQSVFSKHIKQNTILTEDVNTTTPFQFYSVGVASSTPGGLLSAHATGTRIALMIRQDDAPTQRNLFEAYSSTSLVALISSTGGLGLGTTTAAGGLRVQGNALLSGDLRAANIIATGTTLFGGGNYSWPANDGDNGQVLTSNGSGTLTWGSVALSTASSTTFAATTTIQWNIGDNQRLDLSANTDLIFKGGATSTPYTLIVQNDDLSAKTITFMDGICGDWKTTRTVTPGVSNRVTYNVLYDGECYALATTSAGVNPSILSYLQTPGTTYDPNFGVPSPTVDQGTEAAQSFYTTGKFSINKLKVRLSKASAPSDNVVVSIQANSAGAPSGTLLGSGTVAGTSLTASCVTTTVNLDVTVPLEATTTYWIVFDRSGANDATNYYNACGENTSGEFQRGLLALNRAGWVTADTAGTDANFELYGIFR